MCGRYSQTQPLDQVAATFGATVLDAALATTERRRFNIPPTSPVLVVRPEPEGRALRLLRWGLVPHWSRDVSQGSRGFNARADTVRSRPSFAPSFDGRRCLVVADGFYEWQKVGKVRHAFHFQPPEGGLWGFGGLWARWRDPATGQPLETCAIITTEGAPEVQPVHDRMPWVVPPAHWSTWLSGTPDEAAALLALGPPPVACRRVGDYVNHAAHEDARCLDPPDPELALG